MEQSFARSPWSRGSGYWVPLNHAANGQTRQAWLAGWMAIGGRRRSPDESVEVVGGGGLDEGASDAPAGMNVEDVIGASSISDAVLSVAG
jgi:hypothetical protein